MSVFSWTPPTRDLTQWDAHASLDRVPGAVDAILGDYFAAAHREFEHIAPEFTTVIDALESFVVGGGKRVRPTFAWAGFRAGLEGGGGSATPTDDSASKVIAALSALEFVQACALIHDDIIDESDTRRGNPTVHRVFEAQHRDAKWRGPAAHYGISQAILTGDLAFAWADDIVAMSGLNHGMLERVRAPWRAMRSEVIAGQQLDITVENNGSESIDDAMQVIKYKTASYTVARPLHIGAALAGADERTVELLLEYGRLIGTAFQLRDDQLGVFGDPQVTGKPSGDDLRTGKRTVLINLALASELDANGGGAGADIAALRRDLGPRADDSPHSDADIDAMRSLITASGAAAKVEALITDFSSRAIALVTESWLDPAITQELVDFAHLLSDRRF